MSIGKYKITLHKYKIALHINENMKCMNYFETCLKQFLQMFFPLNVIISLASPQNTQAGRYFFSITESPLVYISSESFTSIPRLILS